MSLRRIAAWKLVGAGLLLLAIALGGFCLWCRWEGDRRWELMRARVAEISAQEFGPVSERPVLTGSPQPGNAWDDYVRALRGMSGARMKGGGNTTAAVLQGRKPLDSPEIVTLLQAHASDLEGLRRGARQSSARYPSSAPEPPGTRSVLDPVFLSELAFCRVRGLSAAGELPAALDGALDVARFATDLTIGTPTGLRVYGLGMLVSALEEIRRIVVSDRLDAGALRALGAALGRLDDALPAIAYFEPIGTMEMGAEFLTAPDLAETLDAWGSLRDDDPAAWSLWRYGYSSRLMAALAFEEADHSSRESVATASAPWSEVDRVHEAIRTRLMESPNPLCHTRVARLMMSQRSCREARTRIRLLRAAAALLAGDLMPVLEDPFGTRILEGTKKVWGVGGDQTDDGGNGMWGIQGKDIVLELPR